MKIKVIIPFALALHATIVSGAFAQSTEELAHEYVKIPQVQEMITQFYSGETVVGRIKAMYGLPPGEGAEELAELSKLITENMRELHTDVEKAFENAVAENFTADELKALIAFSDTREGAAVMKKWPTYQAQAMGHIDLDIGRVVISHYREIEAIVKEKKEEEKK